MIIGYARVSTRDQSNDAQIDALTAAGAERIYKDTGSGASTEGRPHYKAMVEALREGDIIVVWKLDRIARSVVDLATLLQSLESRGVGLKCITQPIDTTTSSGRLVVHMLSAVAEFERELIIERTKAGTARARAKGVKFGRPALSPQKRKAIKEMYENGSHSMTDVAATFGVSKTTVHRTVTGSK